MERFDKDIRPPVIFKSALEKEVMVPAYKRALKILERESLSPEMFSDTYNQDMLNRHAAYVEDRKQIFADQRATNESWARAELFGKTLEGILHHQINEGVYGEDVRGVSTTPYDDYHAGIDEVIERYGEDGSTYIGCAIDMTFGNPSKKIQRINDDIVQGRMHDVIYYESPFGTPPHIHGKLQGIPKVVVGMDVSNLIKLSSEWNNMDQEALNKNHLFLNILRQMQMQSEVYSDVAKKSGQEEVQERYNKVHSAVSRLYQEQREAKDIDFLDTSVTEDLVNKAIRTELGKLET